MTTQTTIQPRHAETGDRVRITIEKTLVDVAPPYSPEPAGYARLGIHDDSVWGIADGDDRKVVSVEVLERPIAKPEWWPLQGGDVVLVGATEYFVTTHGDVHYLHSGNRVEDGRGLLGPFKDWLVEWAESSYGKDWKRVKLLVRRGKTYSWI